MASRRSGRWLSSSSIWAWSATLPASPVSSAIIAPDGLPLISSSKGTAAINALPFRRV